MCEFSNSNGKEQLENGQWLHFLCSITKSNDSTFLIDDGLIFIRPILCQCFKLCDDFEGNTLLNKLVK